MVLVDKGCVVNSLYNYPTNLVFFTTPELLEIGDLPMISIGEKPVRAEALKYYRRAAEHYDLDIRPYQKVVKVEGSQGAFAVETRNPEDEARHYRARNVVVATGFYDAPVMMGIPGEHLPKVHHYYREPHPFFGQDVVVVGGSNSAVINALDLARNGARVTLVHRRADIDDKVKYWLAPDIRNRIKEGTIAARFNSKVTAIYRDTVVLETPAGEEILKNDSVLAMTGYRPDFIFLAKLGVEIDQEVGRPLLHPDTFETSRPGVYLAGVVVAGMHTSEIFIENGRFHGKTIAEAIVQGMGAKVPLWADILRSTTPCNLRVTP